MKTGDSRSGIYTADDFKWVSAHEFGHILGVGDMYTNPNYTGIMSIFNGYVGDWNVQGIDITKVLDAKKIKRWQKWK